MKADVAVVGAGPAGSSATAVLARGGFKVILLEEHDRPGEPQHCAGMLTKEACRRLGIRVPGDAVQSEPERVTVHYRGAVLEFGLDMYVLDRAAFDQHMADLAVKSGAELLTGYKVVGMSREGGLWVLRARTGPEVKAELVLGADGYKALSLRWAGLETRREVASCIQYELRLDREVDMGTVSCYFGSSIAPGGYAWVVPIGQREVRVGLGVRRAVRPAKHYLDALVSSLFPSATVLRRLAGLVTTSGPLRRAYAEAFMAVGEAAGHVNPLTGAGIASSIASGRAAALVASRALEGGDLSAGRLSEHYRVWRSAVGRYHELAMEARRLLETVPGRELGDLALRASGSSGKTGLLTAALGFLLRRPRALRLLTRYRDLRTALAL